MLANPLRPPVRYYGQLLCLTFLILWLGVFHTTLIGMISVWANSNTYTHGFLIFPISIYLIWEKRELIEFKPDSSFWHPLVLFLFSGSLWLIARVAGINVIAQLCAITSLNAILLFTLGWQNYKKILFPLLYLFFAVPMGDELVPALQQITADMCVQLLHLCNIPVYREGLYLYIPGGTFEVAEACAGIRFLIASLALGALFAYQFYQSYRKRVLFMMLCIVVPIFANGVRAFGIVYLGYVSDMTVAVGADHLVYGWGFFMFILLLLFFIGRLWQDPMPQTSAVNTPQNTTAATISYLHMLKTTLLAVVLIAPAIMLAKIQTNIDDAPLRLNSASIEKNFAVQDSLAWKPIFESASQELMAKGKWNNQTIELYIADYKADSDGAELISTNNRSFNIDHYSLASNQSTSINDTQVNISELSSVSYPPITIISWYQIGKQSFNQVIKVKLAQLSDKLAGGTGGGRFIAIAFDHNALSATQQTQLLAELKPAVTELRGQHASAK